MNIKLNGADIEVPEGCTVTQLLEQQQETVQGIAVAVNGGIVRKDQRDKLILKEGDNVLIVKAAYGG